MKEINPDPKITAEAVKCLAEWTLEQLPPLEVIAACDRALWWVGTIQGEPLQPPADDPTLFYQLEPGATFLAYRKGRTLYKTEQGAATDCPWENCPQGETYYNTSNGQAPIHVCPDTPILEVPF